MNSDQELRSGIVAAVSAYLLWGGLTLYWKLLNDFRAFELIGWRVVSSAAIMVVVLTSTRRWSHLRPVLTDPKLFGRTALAAALLSFNWCTYVWAVVNDNVIETALGYFMSPLGTVAIGVVVFREKLRRSHRIGIGFAALAVVVLTVSYGSVPWIAIGLASSWSLYGLLKKQMPLTPLESMSAESFVVVVPAIVIVALMSDSPQSITQSATTGQIVLVALTGLVTVLPLMLFAWAAQRVPMTVLGPMQYFVPSVNFLLGWLLFHERLPLPRLVGFGLVWAGLAVMSADALRRQPNRVESPAVSAAVSRRLVRSRRRRRAEVRHDVAPSAPMSRE